jgi:hypothetical protein
MNQSVSTKEARSARAMLLAKIYEVDPLRLHAPLILRLSERFQADR